MADTNNTQQTPDIAAEGPVGNRRVVHATCVRHSGPRGFTNVVMTRAGGTIRLDPHATGACVLELDEAEATAVRDQLTGWLG